MGLNDLPEDWVERLKAGDRGVLSRVITCIENNTLNDDELVSAVGAYGGCAQIVAFTGPPGVGKSTLTSCYIKALRDGGSKVCVIAIDPSNHVNGGAVLGDRIRYNRNMDSGIFFRSLSTRGQLGGLSRATARVANVMDAAGADVIAIETVGTGQVEVDVADLATTTVLLSSPNQGDSIQAIKAGILDIADIIVINKADIDGSEIAKQELTKATAHRNRVGSWQVPVLGTVATDGIGIEELVDAIKGHYQQEGRERRRTLSLRWFESLLQDAALDLAMSKVQNLSQAQLEKYSQNFLAGEISFADVAASIVSSSTIE